jgi:hypothetical protein
MAMDEQSAVDCTPNGERLDHMRFLRRTGALSFNVIEPETQMARRRLLGEA